MPEVLQVEFSNALNRDALNNASFCLAINNTLCVGRVPCMALCATFVARAQDALFMSAAVIAVDNGSDIYAPGLAGALTAELRKQGFFTLDESYVFFVAPPARNVGLLISFTVVLLAVLIVSTIIMFTFAKPPSRSRVQPAGVGEM